MEFIHDSDLVCEHRHWFSVFRQQHLRNWKKLLTDNPETAMCEAEVRRLLEHNNIQVRPNEDLRGSNQEEKVSGTVFR